MALQQLMKRGVEGDLVKVIEKTEENFKTFFDSSNKIEIKTNLQYLQPRSSTKFDKNGGGIEDFLVNIILKTEIKLIRYLIMSFLKKHGVWLLKS